MDFTMGMGHQTGDGLLIRWEQEVPKIISFLINGNVKDKSIRTLLERLQKEEIEQSKSIRLYE